MPVRGILLDASLLVLLVVGTLDASLIAKHRRLRDYSVGDFRYLVDYIEHTAPLRVIPHVLAEASNLIGAHGDPERELMMEQLGLIVEASVELQIPSASGALRSEFPRLGLTDSMLLEAATSSIPLFTADGPLFEAALRSDPDCAILFNPTGAG